MTTKTKKAPKKGNTFEEYILERLKNTEAEAEEHLKTIALMAQEKKDMQERLNVTTGQLNALKSLIEVSEIDWLGKPEWMFSMSTIFPNYENYKKIKSIFIVEEPKEER